MRGFRVTVFLLLIFLLFSGCKTKYVTVPEYHNVYIHNTDSFVRSDTLMMRDSNYQDAGRFDDCGEDTVAGQVCECVQVADGHGGANGQYQGALPRGATYDALEGVQATDRGDGISLNCDNCSCNNNP